MRSTLTNQLCLKDLIDFPPVYVSWVQSNQVPDAHVAALGMAQWPGLSGCIEAALGMMQSMGLLPERETSFRLRRTASGPALLP